MQPPYKVQPLRSFWKTAIGNNEPSAWLDLYNKKFDITGLRLATAGSCFAQHIGQALKDKGLPFLDMEPPPSFLAEQMRHQYNFGLFSARYGNIYTTRQLLQLIERAYGTFEPKDDVWEREHGFVDAFRPNIEPKPFLSVEEVRSQRQFHLAKVRELFQLCQVFIFTLGLTETWLDARDGAAYPVVPGTALGGKFDPECYKFHNLNYNEVVDDLENFYRRLLTVSPGCKMILTVSPVPMVATATNRNILDATIYSKSVLRAAAGYLADTHSGIDYFPSYEVIASHSAKGQYFIEDGRTVSKTGVRMAMTYFFNAHCIGAPIGHIPLKHIQQEQRPSPGAGEEICDEIILNAFLKEGDEN